MPNSMTAFGRSRGTSQDGSKIITVEIKSVNSRYMDATVKLPRMYAYLEEKVKGLLAAQGVSRGKVEVYIGVEVLQQTGTDIVLDTALAAAYIHALEQLRDQFGLRDDLSVMRVAQNKELFSVRTPEDDDGQDWADVCPILTQALVSFLEQRRAEGQRLIDDIEGKLVCIRAICEKIGEISETDIQGYTPKLVERIKKFLQDFDAEANEQRILTEAAIYADKAAIDEELVRLNSHFATFREIVERGEAVGRKLDFLLQEMNREINTIGSKAGNTDIAHLVVDVKALLEKIREQVQNIE
ncbi:hypothetical protein IMSAG013_00312 [Clostridiales bacterium]|nr:YicC family protein [Clostridiales bacterium]GFI55270.1 hypothetical protein IMSAG013_00312 [Clostridiales bacterium]